ncbi:DUF3035 domain-containing protein [Roseovarius sp. Pro17]|uniref:DUF3035 domain-containing protein n=1 Tax=Roseovarius sp. Pro17 TaxID=3108175 RepID=UPI002D79769C|nr:DUF3035 domain-containing protein [Roseovarius sp. Pro17]
MRRSILALTVLTLALAACGRSDGTLTRIKNTGDGPDEFTVLPTKPLQTPETYNVLPAPTPGGANLVDTNPRAEGVAALGGNPAATVPGNVGAGDGGLVNHARRHGVTPAVRQTLAAEDAQTRRRHGRVNIFNIGPNDDYTDAYKKQWLDSQAEQQRMTRSGVVTPSAPPPQ